MVVVTVGIVVFATGFVVALRVLVLRGALGAVAVDLDAVAVRGIKALACVLINYTGKGVDKIANVTKML